MDTYKFTIDSYNYTYLTIIDYHTRWVEAQEVKGGAQEVISLFLRTWITRFGCPKTITTDAEAILSGSVMRNLCEILGIKLIRTIACHPDGNAPIESFHRVLHKGLQRYAMAPSSLQLSIDEIIQLTLLGYRSAFHLSTGETPAYLTFGFDPSPPKASIFKRNNPIDTERIQLLNDIREAIVQSSYLKKIREIIREQRSRIKTKLEIGDLILLPINRAEAAFHAITHRGRKLLPKYTMPYRVTRVLNDGRAAHCRNLVPVTGYGLPRVKEVREISIQDARMISPPLTPGQIKDWENCLRAYLLEFPLDEGVKDKLYNDFWVQIEEPKAQDIRKKRARNN